MLVGLVALVEFLEPSIELGRAFLVALDALLELSNLGAQSVRVADNLLVLGELLGEVEKLLLVLVHLVAIGVELT